LEGWLLAIIKETKQKIAYAQDEEFLHAKLSANPKHIVEILKKTWG